jgi:hypothetical protein
MIIDLMSQRIIVDQNREDTAVEDESNLLECIDVYSVADSNH